MLRGLIGPGNCTNDRNGGKDGSIKIELYHLADDPLKLGTWPLSIPAVFLGGMQAELEAWSHLVIGSLNGMDYASLSR